MAKYLVETYYTCSFKVNHYLDDINENELKNLEKRNDGKFEILDVKLDNRKTKSLDQIKNKAVENKNVEVLSEKNLVAKQNKENKIFSNYIYLNKESNKLPFIPFSSSFMVLAKNK